MSCCAERPLPDTNIDIDHMGSHCSVWAHMKDMFDYLAEERAGAVPCDSERYSVQFSFVDAMTFLFVLTDNLLGKTIEYTVRKEFTKESAQEAFERDYRERELRHNRGVVRALEDVLEAFTDANPSAGYKLSRHEDGYRISRPIQPNLGVIAFKIDHSVEITGVPITFDQFNGSFPDLPNDLGRAMEVLIKRFMKLGVVFEDVVIEETIEKYRKVYLTGHSFRTTFTHNVVKISLQEIAMTDSGLSAYHEYFTI